MAELVPLGREIAPVRLRGGTLEGHALDHVDLTIGDDVVILDDPDETLEHVEVYSVSDPMSLPMP